MRSSPPSAIAVTRRSGSTRSGSTAGRRRTSGSTPTRSQPASPASRAGDRRHRVLPGAGARIRPGAARDAARRRGRDAPGRAARAPPHPDRARRCVRAGRPLPHGRLSAHERRHGEGRRGPARVGLHTAAEREAARRHDRRDAACRRRRDLRARRGAGACRARARHRDDRPRRLARRARATRTSSRPKRQLFGKVGIDLVAGPTEILVIADETADPGSSPPICSARPSTARHRRPC